MTPTTCSYATKHAKCVWPTFIESSFTEDNKRLVYPPPCIQQGDVTASREILHYIATVVNFTTCAVYGLIRNKFKREL